MCACVYFGGWINGVKDYYFENANFSQTRRKDELLYSTSSSFICPLRHDDGGMSVGAVKYIAGGNLKQETTNHKEYMTLYCYCYIKEFEYSVRVLSSSMMVSLSLLCLFVVYDCRGLSMRVKRW